MSAAGNDPTTPLAATRPTQPAPHGGALPRGTRIGAFVIEEALGRGGMGVVYRARHATLGRPAALKLMAPDLARDATSRERFLREARLASAIAHPHVVAIHDAGEHDGALWLAMELVAGGDLTRLLRERPAGLDEATALRLTEDAACGLEALHRAGLIHRDIKPQNILLDADGRARLADFGLARLAASDSGLTAAGHPLGTWAFSAPEQLRGDERIDIRADIYALASTLYALLTGAPPFSGASQAELVGRVLHAPAPDVRVRRPEVSARTAALLQRAMAKDPELRPLDPRALIDALAAARVALASPAEHALAAPTLSGGETIAPPPRARSRRARLALAALAVAVAVAGVALWRQQAPAASTASAAPAPTEMEHPPLTSTAPREAPAAPIAPLAVAARVEPDPAPAPAPAAPTIDTAVRADAPAIPPSRSEPSAAAAPASAPVSEVSASALAPAGDDAERVAVALAQRRLGERLRERARPGPAWLAPWLEAELPRLPEARIALRRVPEGVIATCSWSEAELHATLRREADARERAFADATDAERWPAAHRIAALRALVGDADAGQPLDLAHRQRVQTGPLPATLAEAARELAARIAPAGVGTFEAGAATPGDEPCASAFGLAFAEALAAACAERGWNRTATTAPAGTRGFRPAAAPARLLAAYWIDGERLRLAAALVTATGWTSAETIAPAAAASGLALAADGAERATSDWRALGGGGADERGNGLSLWTDRGAERVAYRDGERMRVYVEVQRPCWLRVVYRLADGRLALLADGVRIDVADVGRPYAIPGDFVCGAPFGVESLHVAAAAEPFAPLRTRVVDGYPLIDGDGGARGFRPAGDVDERSVAITTVAR